MTERQSSLDNSKLRRQYAGDVGWKTRSVTGRVRKMALVTFTRPDDTKVSIESEEVLRVAPVPPKDSALGGPLDRGTRIVFKNNAHQDVKELPEEVTQKLNAA
jgi:hypothetical protein